MTCNGKEKTGMDCFEKILAQKRATGFRLSAARKNPKKPSLLMLFCNVIFSEALQDDAKKPFIHRDWMFNKNGSIVEYSELRRYLKIYDH